MKILYLNIILFIGIMVFSHVYIDKTIDNAIKCGHIDTVSATKFTHGSKGHNNSTEGTDISCYIKWELNGKKYDGEEWNIGDCNDTAPVTIQVVDYICH